MSAQLEKVVLHEEVKKAVHDEVTLTTYVRTCPWSSDGLECLQNGELAAGYVQLEGYCSRVNRAFSGVSKEALAPAAVGDSCLNPAALHVCKEALSRV